MYLPYASGKQQKASDEGRSYATEPVKSNAPFHNTVPTGLVEDNLTDACFIDGRPFPCLLDSECDLRITSRDECGLEFDDESLFNDHARSVSSADLRDLQDHIQNLLNHGIIQESKSRYASPIVLVHKKNGKEWNHKNVCGLHKIELKDYTGPVHSTAY